MDKHQIIQALEEERDALELKLKSLELTILTMKQSLNQPAYTNGHSNGSNGSFNKHTPTPKKYDGYASAKSNKKKASIIIREAGRFLHIRQIREIAKTLEPNANEDELAKGIQQAIYALKADGLIVAYKASDSNIDSFWGSKYWLDDNGKPKKEHAFDESQLAANKEEKFEI